MKSTIKQSNNIDTMISLNNIALDRVCSYKYLGFILDDRLNFNKHISEMCNLVSHKLYLLSKIRKYLTQSACISIFKTMILSLIEYGDIIYEGTSARNLDNISKLFYKGLRICCMAPGQMSKLELCYECAISPLNIRRDVHQLLFMHKQLYNKDLLNISKVNTRLHQAPVFKLYKPNNEKAKQNILYRGATNWNALPAVNRNKNSKLFATWLKGDRYNV